MGARSGRSRRAILAVAITSIALETALLGMVAPLLPEIEARTDAGDEALGLAFAAYAIPILLTSIAVGRIADRTGRRSLLLSGLALTGIGSILIAIPGSLTPLLAGRIVQGFGATLSWVAALSLVSDLARPNRKGEALGFALAANSLGAIGGPALGGIVGGTISFEAPFVLIAALTGLTFAIGFAVLPRTEPTTVEFKRSRVMHRLLQRGTLVPATAIATEATMLGMIDFVVPIDLDRRLGTTATVVGVIFAALALIDAMVAPQAGRASDRLGRRPVALLGAATAALSGILLVILGGLAGTCVSLAILAVGLSIIFAASTPWLDESFDPLDRGLAYGCWSLITSLGFTLGPLIGGLLLSNDAADVAYALITVLATLIAAMLVVPTRPPSASRGLVR